MRWGLVAGLSAVVWGYRLLIRPVLPPMCRFHPSCSEYMLLALKKHGPVKGFGKGVWRVCRCHPYNAGGEDWP